MGALKVFLIAGEPSGDVLGGCLLAGLRQLAPGLEIDGVGGPLMQAEGLKSRFDMSELSVMGIAEVLPKFRQLVRRINETAAAIIDAAPDVLITIDSPDFSLRVARRVKAASSIRTVHYVAPTVWAWRPGRARNMAQVIDHVLALFPFEPPFMEAEGMACDFVGHPAAVIPPVSATETAAFRSRHGVEKANPLILALPGSRRGEVTRLGAVFGQALGVLKDKRPEMQAVLPMAPPVADALTAQVAGWSESPILLDPRGIPTAAAQREKRVAFAAADVALAASGSVALELAAAGTPMVSAYDLHWLSRAIISQMMTTDSVSLINLVSETRAVPEVLGKDVNAANLVTALESVLIDPSAQISAMKLTMERLGRGGEDPGLRAAHAVLSRL